MKLLRNHVLEMWVSMTPVRGERAEWVLVWRKNSYTTFHGNSGYLEESWIRRMDIDSKECTELVNHRVFRLLGNFPVLGIVPSIWISPPPRQNASLSTCMLENHWRTLVCDHLIHTGAMLGKQVSWQTLCRRGITKASEFWEQQPQRNVFFPSVEQV